jgi:ethanolamine transporter EutH
MQNSNDINKLFMTWRTSLVFVVLATVAIVLVGWLISKGLLPIRPTIKRNEAEGLRFIQVWIRIAIPIGLVLPTIAFITWFKRPEARRIFGFYLLLIAIQVVTERIVSELWVSSLVVFIGTIYTAFRVWQLWQSLQLMRTTQRRSQYRSIRNILWLLLLFWSSNLIVLFTVAWHSVL